MHDYQSYYYVAYFELVLELLCNIGHDFLKWPILPQRKQGPRLWTRGIDLVDSLMNIILKVVRLAACAWLLIIRLKYLTHPQISDCLFGAPSSQEKEEYLYNELLSL